MGLTRDRRPEPAAAAEPAGADVAALLARLHADDPEERRGAVRALAGCAEAVPAMVRRVAVESDLALRELLLATVASYDGRDTALLLVVQLRTAAAALRVALADTLAQMPRGVEIAIDALRTDPDPAARALAVMVLSSLRHPDVPAWLAGIVAADADANVVAAAIGELAEVGEAEHVGTVRAAAARFAQDEFLQFCAATATVAIQERSVR